MHKRKPMQSLGQAMVATRTSKGQVRVPAAVRRHLGIAERDRIAFVLGEGGAGQRPPLPDDRLPSRHRRLTPPATVVARDRGDCPGGARRGGSALAVREPHIDTEAIVRLVTGDDPIKQAQATWLFEAMEAGS